MVKGIFAAGREETARALRRSTYKVVRAVAEGGHLRVGDGNLVSGPIVWIEDLDGPLSVTNDAERVCTELQAHYPGYRFIYRDSMGNWDELAHRNGEFTGFLPARHLAL